MPKNSEDYGKFHNPDFAYESNFHAITEPMSVDADTLARLKAQDEGAIAEIKQKLQERGESGTFIIQQPIGGLGRRGKWETEAEWRSKRKAGMPEIVRIEVD